MLHGETWEGRDTTETVVMGTVEADTNCNMWLWTGDARSSPEQAPLFSKCPVGQPQVDTWLESRVFGAVAVPGAKSAVMHVEPSNTAEATQRICLCLHSQKHRPLEFRGSGGGSLPDTILGTNSVPHVSVPLLVVQLGRGAMSQLEMSW